MIFFASRICTYLFELFDSFPSNELSQDLCTQLLDRYSSLIVDGRLLVSVPKVTTQNNSNDCGFYTIAFCTVILLGCGDPPRVVFEEKQLRSQIALFQGLGMTREQIVIAVWDVRDPDSDEYQIASAFYDRLTR